VRLGVSDSLVSRIRRTLIWTDQAAMESVVAVIDRTLILMAAWTGMRQGELFGLRWRGVDWLARKARVRRAWVHGEFGMPKSKRSSRGVSPRTELAGQGHGERHDPSARCTEPACSEARRDPGDVDVRRALPRTRPG
jgi:integrase